MSQAEISQSIEALHAEIAQLASTDVAVKEKLLALIKDIETQLDNPQNQDRDQTVQDLPTLIEQFEADHPRVTANLSRLLTTLSGMGI